MFFFVGEDPREGNAVYGKVPGDMESVSDNLYHYYQHYHDNDKMKRSTHHIWVDDIKDQKIRQDIRYIQNHQFWKKLFSYPSLILNITEMDEIYYSDPRDISHGKNLYGSKGNFGQHRDAFFRFPNITMYRVILSISKEKNTNTFTYLTKYDKKIKLQYGQFLAFDFDRTTHEVLKQDQTIHQPRLLLKLHFIVYNDNKNTNKNNLGNRGVYLYHLHHHYINTVRKIYILYENTTRYFMENGTDPETFFQFFCGLLCQYNQTIISYFFILFISSVVYSVVDIRNRYHHPGWFIVFCKIFFFGVFLFLVMFNFIVSIFWIRYKLYRIR